MAPEATPTHKNETQTPGVSDKGSLHSSNEPVPVSLDAMLEQKVWRKMDLCILPVVSLFWLLSFLDRTNLGNARVAGLQKSLQMTNDEYSMALTITYIPYILAELPSNLLLRTVGADLMLPTMLTLWGVVTVCQGAVKSYSGLLACRWFLGLLEGGVFPGLVLYLSEFYPRDKLHLRISLFFACASLSSAFSGLLAFGIINMDGLRGKPGWAWIFILEGLFTVLFGLSSYFILPRTPEKARFLSQHEKQYVLAQLNTRGASAGVDQVEDKFSWSEVVKAFKSPQVLLMAIMFFPAGTTLFGLAYFTPSIVQSFGYSPTRTQLLSVPPFAVAFVVSLVAAWISDRYHARGMVTIAMSCLCVVGFAMFLGSVNRDVQYASLFFSITGTYSAAPALSAWNANNITPHIRRAAGIAIGFIMTNSGGILATWLLGGTLSPPPRYTKATIVLLVLNVVGILAAAGNIVYLRNQNRKKTLQRATSTREEEDAHLGDRSAWFIYSL